MAVPHTAGPWEIRRYGIYSQTARPDWSVDPDDAYERVCVIQTLSACSNPEGDLPLIAEAPVMLAALRKAEAFISGFEGDPEQNVDADLADIRAILARIEGA